MNCSNCTYARPIPGDAHFECTTPAISDKDRPVYGFRPDGVRP